jgi:hypothetical protein
MKKILFILMLSISALGFSQSSVYPALTTGGISQPEIQYLYKTVYVDSAKIRNYFDTLIISKPGLNKIIVIDEVLVTHNGLLNYNSIAGFMMYSDTILGNNGTGDVIDRLFYWETKASSGNSVFGYPIASVIKIKAFISNQTCIVCPDPENWLNSLGVQPWETAINFYNNTAYHFLAGDFFYAFGTHNTSGRRIFKFSIKYHIETI